MWAASVPGAAPVSYGAAASTANPGGEAAAPIGTAAQTQEWQARGYGARALEHSMHA